MGDNSINAGVRAQNGFALQRNSALYILLKDYHSKFEDKRYFICLEHHDDFLFCFLDNDDNAKLIDAYQSKKKSPSEWTINNAFDEIIIKLLDTGNKLIHDPIKKTDFYNHNLYFSSNSTISLKAPKSQKNTSISEENCLFSFKDLDQKIKEKIKTRLKDKLTVDLKNELDNLHFIYIEFARTDKTQQKQLYGEIIEVFGKKITDGEAAIKALLSLFQGIELTYNQGNEAKLLDETKRVTSEKINDTLKIITTKSKAFDYWRNEKKAIRKVLNIKPYEDDKFNLDFESAFDLFKSITEVEHRRILKFVEENYQKCSANIEEEATLELFKLLGKELTTTFDDLDLKQT